ncbi:aminodeoxychorismate/anthranilate synthase component II [Candidatus Haliotispira prima]|uniref:Aminodeoxychorismate/anthranilate synthase component II n=1 Tax=Candidatus Haliotispira prima TaxID=3034016 RepID=A0ABY8MHT9_9SPIO|nr:aminodeoxychorismate/anthranilate synthase component II [Candidatus Haliotispira prima]
MSQTGNKALRFLMIDHYDSFTYNLLALIRLQGIEIDLIKEDEYHPINGSEKTYHALIFSPGPGGPDRTGSSLQYFDEWVGKLPIFGVCLGMQIMAHKLQQRSAHSSDAHAAGPYVVHQAASIQHGKTDRLRIRPGSQIFAGIPDGITVVRYHSLAIGAPEEQISSRAFSDGEVMSLEIPELKLYGVQFHPESLLSECGAKMINNFAALL